MARASASPPCLAATLVRTRPPRALRVRVKRVYESPARADGFRVLVDRLWPRGLSKDRAALSAWAKEIAPSTALRQWLHQDPARWAQFRVRYRRELKEHAVELEALRQVALRRPVTLLYAAHSTVRNHALVLKGAIEQLHTRAAAHLLRPRRSRG